MSSPVSFGGLQSGINTSQIINSEIAIFEQPLVALQSQQGLLTTQIADYQTVNSDLLSLQQAGDALANSLAFDQAFSVSSSNASVVTGAITSGSHAGSITLAVDRLATRSTQISAGTVAATSDVVASGDYLVASGGAALGIQSFTGQSGLATGAHTIQITQASAGATVVSTTPPLASTTISSGNDTLNVTVDGVASTVTIASGTYTPTQLAQAITQASGGTLSATIGSGGNISLATSQQGSSATLQVTGGSALGSLGLATSGVVAGIDGIVNVDGTATTVTNIAATGTTPITLASGAGSTLSVNLSGPLNLGTITAQNVSVGNGSLDSVISAINGANAGVTATALQMGTNSYALEVTSNETGSTGAGTIDTQAFAASALGAIQVTTAAQDAIVSVGGVGGPQVVSSSNAVTGLLPGVTANLTSVSSTPVTLNVAADGSQVAGRVSALVDAANKVLTEISTDTAYNASTNVAAPLNGQTSLSSLAQRVLALVGNAVGASAAGSDGQVGESAGLAITSAGTISFNQSAFVKAYNLNPQAVQSMFIQGGSFSPSTSPYAGQVTFAGASDHTTPGSYGVSISQSAAQAIDVGSTAFSSTGATLASGEVYTITSGGVSANYAATSGESLSTVVSGLNASLAAAGIGVSASLSGVSGSSHLQLNSTDYGAAAAFTVTTSGTDQLGLTTSGTSFHGTDVVGTINGVAATGLGQTLSLASPSNPANGLSVLVSTPGITTATTLGTMNYSPGMAQGLASLAVQTTLAPGGQIAAATTGLNSTLNDVTSEIALQKQLVATQRAMLTQEFNAMETQLAQLSSESKFLASSSSSSSSSSLFNSGSTLSTG